MEYKFDDMTEYFIISDLHGQGKIYDYIFDHFDNEATKIKKKIVLIINGDIIDRGNDSIRMLVDIMDRVKNGKGNIKIVMLPGNHEEMMRDAIKSDHPTLPLLDWLNNGGSSTFYDLEKESLETQKHFARVIGNLPTEYIYHSPKGHSVIMEHSGFSPFNVPRRTHMPLWDREHFDDEWDCGYDYEDLDPNKTYLVHGHTPVQFLHYFFGYNGQDYEKDVEYFKAKKAWNRGDEKDIKEFCPKPQILHYCEGHKIDVDLCTAATGVIALLDLDTFEEIYFEG